MFYLILNYGIVFYRSFMSNGSLGQVPGTPTSIANARRRLAARNSSPLFQCLNRLMPIAKLLREPTPGQFVEEREGISCVAILDDVTRMRGPIAANLDAKVEKASEDQSLIEWKLSLEFIAWYRTNYGAIRTLISDYEHCSGSISDDDEPPPSYYG